MPRFSFGEEVQGTPLGASMTPLSSAAVSSPSNLSFSSPSAPGVLPGGGRNEQQLGSVKLTCLSPDDRFMHSVGGGGSFIETRRLPLSQLQEDRADLGESEPPSRIRTPLPAFVRSALRIDPPVELLCAEGETNLPRRKVESDPRQGLPRLCLYTKKSAFLLELSYEKAPEGQPYPDPVQGSVVSVTQPFERYLESSAANEILRIRPAPQRHAGFCTMCPGASIAALVVNTDLDEYSLFVHHSNGKVMRPLEFGMECLEDRAREQIVDFCFAQSNELSILSSLSIVLLKGSGDLLTASPIIFDGAVVSSSCLRDGLDYLGAVIESTDRSAALWRQCRAAQQFLLDVFGGRPAAKEQFSTARVVALVHQNSSVVNWPVTNQGPVLHHSAMELGSPALCLENFGSHASFVGLAVGKLGYAIDFAVLSPTSLVPRFAFENDNDRSDIDDRVCKLGAWVERLELTQPPHATPSRSITLLPDPVVDSLLHYATPRSVVSVSTNVMRLIGNRGPNHRTMAAPTPVRTTAWSCLQTSNDGMPLQGIVIRRDAEDGEHELLACQTNGSVVTVNVTEVQFKREVDMLFQNSSSQSSSKLALTNGPSSAANNTVASLDSTTPLFESIKGLVSQVQKGLAGMGKIVGSSTSYTDITPDTLAVAASVKERCDKELVLPLLELKKVVTARRERLHAVLQGQRKQLEVLSKERANQKKLQQQTIAALEAAESNAVSLLERATYTQQGCRTLIPKVTDAEYAFFKDMERLKEKVAYMETQLKEVNERIKTQSGSMSKSKLSASLKPIDPDCVRKANALLDEQANTLNRIRTRLAAVEDRSGSILD